MPDELGLSESPSFGGSVGSAGATGLASVVSVVSGVSFVSFVSAVSFAAAFSSSASSVGSSVSSFNAGSSSPLEYKIDFSVRLAAQKMNVQAYVAINVGSSSAPK